MMKRLINEKKQEILDDAPEWATVLLEKVCDGMSEYAIEKCGSFWDMQDVSQNNPYGNAFVTAAWNVKCNLSDIRKELELEAEPQPITPKLIYLIDIFKAEFPQGFQSLDGYSREDFDDEVLSMSSHAGLIKFVHFTAANKALLKPEGKKTVVDAVNYFKGDYPLKRSCNLSPVILEDHQGSLHSGGKNHIKGLFDVACTIKEFNQCVTDLTGCPLKHAAWLTALNDMRDDEQKPCASELFEGEVPVEWQNGDVVSMTRNIGLDSPVIDDAIYYGENDSEYWLKLNEVAFSNIYKKSEVQLSKPETAEQKAEREREAKAIAMHNLFRNDLLQEWNSLSDVIQASWFRLVDAGVKLPE